MCTSNGGLTVPKKLTVLFKSALFKDSLLYNIQCTLSFNDSIPQLFFCDFSFKVLILGILIIQTFFSFPGCMMLMAMV